MAELIRRLGDARWQVREESQRALISRGREAVAPLSSAVGSPDPEVAQRARLILSRVDPMVLRVRILRISAEAEPRLIEALEGRGVEAPAGAGEIAIPEGLDPSERSTGYAVRYRLLPDDRVDLSIEEVYSNSTLRTSLLAAGRERGSVGVLKRGEESLYRQVGAQLERERHPFIVTAQWWTDRRGSTPPAGRAAPPSAEALAELERDLLAQAAGGDLEGRQAALEVLGVLHPKGAESTFRRLCDDPALRIPSLIGLIRMGDAAAGGALEEALRGPLDDEETGPPLPATLAGSPRSQPGRPSGVFWQTRAALALVEARRPAGFEHFARRICDVAPSDLHQVLATLADHLEDSPAASRALLLEALASPEFLIHLPWEDPEVEYFYGRVAGVERDAAQKGAGAPALLTERLILTLARALCTEGGMGGGRSRSFANLWERITGGAEMSGLARRVLKDVLASPGSPLRLSEIVAWLGLAFRDQPMPDEEFDRLLAVVRATLERNDSSLRFWAPAAALEIARGPALTERQFAELMQLLAEVGSMPNQPMGQEILRELEGLTGLSVRKTKRAVTVRAPVRTVEGGRAPAPAVAAPADDDDVIERTARWAADPALVHAAYLRFTGADPAGRPPEAIELWDFDLLVPNRPARAVRGASAEPAPPRRAEVLSAARVEAVTGKPFQYRDRWGNRLTHRVDVEGESGARYRLDGSTYVEPDLPVQVSLRDKELRIAWYESSDVRLGASYLSRSVSQRLQRLICIRPLGAAPPGEGDPQALWEAFQKGFLESLSARPSPQRSQLAVNLIRDLGLKDAVGFLAEEFRRGTAPRRTEVAQVMLELGDSRGVEFLRGELKEADVTRRVQAAQVLLSACDRAGFEEMLRLLGERRDEIRSYLYPALVGLESFLANCSPTGEERSRAIDLFVQNLNDPSFQARGFQLLAREAGTDFKFSEASRITSLAARNEAKARAVEEARRWWAAHRAPPPAAK